MKIFESDRFQLLTDQLERAADELAECGEQLYGSVVPVGTLVAAALTRATERRKPGLVRR